MQIEGIRLSSGNVTLSAEKITGRQLLRALDRIAGDAQAAGAAGAGTALAQPPGPGAVRRPSDAFASDGAALASDPASGFAAGGATQIPRLDTRGVLDMLMRFLQQLVVSLMQALMSGEAQGGQTGQTGGGTQPSPGGSCSGGQGGSAPAGGATTAPPAGGASQPSGAQQSAPASQTPAGPPATSTPGDATPPRNALTSACRPRASRCGRGARGGVGRILARIGKGAAGAASGAAAGGPVGAALGGATALGGGAPGRGSVLAMPPRSAGAPAGGSLEDQIAAFFRSQLKQVEGELQGAMQQAQAGGGEGQGGDSRALASSKVQQLVQKRSEMIEMLTNALKTSHESSLTVARNLK